MHYLFEPAVGLRAVDFNKYTNKRMISLISWTSHKRPVCVCLERVCMYYLLQEEVGGTYR